MELIDWLWILHPALAVVVIYPLMGMTVYLGRQTRHRRVDRARLPATVAHDHRHLGKWLATGMVIVVLVAITVSIVTKSFWSDPGQQLLRAASLLLVLAGTVVALLVLWRVQQRWQRILFALLTWAGVLGLGAQPEVWRVSDDPGTFAFWTSHYWTGMGLVALTLFSMAVSPETARRLAWRQVHMTAGVVAAILFLVQGISGSKDLLEIPLNWQKPAIYQCDFSARRCPGAEQAITPTTVLHPVG
ncbi:MAG: membrane protein [Candidatus Synechococcus spongiarum 15L]|uniref:Membrane protein n=1 Tax=Candidatus Synechococcus spongiarum 15L TaxID=1608419 RepID=A0A0G8AT41_9SYNE|nr:MAG: membrane protein [Candidatus Synechococcus spongiarum 15L]